MKRLLILSVALLALSVGPRAQEAVSLTVAIAKPSTTSCALDSLLLDVAGKRIVASLTCNNGDTLTKQYDAFTTPTGAALLTTLNRSNNAVGQPSLIAKTYNRLVADGVLTGSISGTPQ